MTGDDLFDVVDSRDCVVGNARRSYVHAHGLLHRAAHVLMFRGAGENREILLQKRALTKDTYAGAYTTSCSGHVDSGEDYDTAVVREMFEETGLSVKISELEKIGKISACPETGNEFTFVYLLECGGGEIFNPPADEVDSLDWVKVSDFEKMCASIPSDFTPSFICVYRFYLSKREKRL